MEIKSNLGDFTYDNKDVVRIFNPKQRDLYLMNGIMPKDIYVSVDNKTEEKILVYIFLKEETREAYSKWLNYELTQAVGCEQLFRKHVRQIRNCYIEYAN